MKEYKIEIEFDEKGNIKAETFGMQGTVCAEELDEILKGISGKRNSTNTADYYKKRNVKQTIRRS